MSGRSDCRKFAPNIFNKSKCTNCFRQKEEHSAEALESNRVDDTHLPVIMSEERDLVKKRGSFKGRLTAFINYLDSLKDKPLTNCDVSELQLRLGKMESLYEQYDEVQLRLECIVDDIKLQYSERSEFESLYYKSLSTAQNLVTDYNKDTKSMQSCESTRAVVHKPVKLPTIQLPKFSGCYSNWLEFRDTFTSLIHSNDSIDEINKFHYLRASLESTAAVVIKSIEFCSNNYTVAWKLLRDRFDNKRLLVQNHISALFNIDSLVKESSNSIKGLIDQINKNLRALESLGEPVTHWDTLLIYIITRKLDSKTYREWEECKSRLDKDSVVTFDVFMQFLRDRADLIETLELSRTNYSQTVTKSGPKIKSMISTQSTNSSSTESIPKLCPKCNSHDHQLNNCPQFLALSIDARLKLLPNYKVCFNCFRSGHFANKCKRPGCKLCKRRHNTLIHTDPRGYVVNALSDNTVPNSTNNLSPLSADINTNNIALSANVPSCSGNHTQRDVLLSTALVKLRDNNNCVHLVRAVLDSGSTSSFITERLCKQLHIKTKQVNRSILGINNTTSHVGNICRVKMASLNDNFEFSLNCFVLPFITSSVPSREINTSRFDIPSNICLADPTYYKPAEVDILIGCDYFWELLGSQKLRLGTGNPVLCETRLGWIVSGPITQNCITLLSTNLKCNLTKVTSDNDSNWEGLKTELTKFWQLEEIDTKSATYMPEEKLCEDHFVSNTTRMSDGRFCVRLPLKNDPSILGSSFNKSTHCLRSLERRLKVKPDFNKLYHNFMLEYESLGHMTKLKVPTSNLGYFIPHHGILRESSSTTKLRVVFNASCPTSTGVSLNDLQMVGPTVQDDLLSILLRFRLHKYVLSADVEKMYRQIVVHPSDRYLQQIVWRENVSDPINIYELNTVTYGTASAPFLATRCLIQVGLDCKNPKVSNIIRHDFYVDDLLTGCDTLQDIKLIRDEITKALASACMPLRKWRSNDSQVVSEVIPTSLNLNIGSNEPDKLLGLGWYASSDELGFPFKLSLSTNRYTKRDLLSVIARIFDPLGLLSPIVITMKILLQIMWLDKLSWDEPLPSKIEKDWDRIVKCLPVLNDLRISRRVVCDEYTELELHIFTDASESAYGACVYLRSKNNEGVYSVRLLMAKSRVAPIKPTTIPRLELCGAVVGSRLYDKVRSSLRVEVSRVYCWTDSTIVLGWLQMMPTKLQPFVRNRVAEVLDKTGNCNWRHVPTDQNPADLISRGVDISNLQGLDLWWSGPDFLKQNPSEWPSQSKSLGLDTLPETRPNIVLSAIIGNNTNTALIDFSRYSKYSRLVRSVAYMLRFIKSCRKHYPKTKYLSQDELQDALNLVIFKSQNESFPEHALLLNKQNLPVKSPLLKFNVYLDDNNLMRVGGRLVNSSFEYNKKHPILLQSTHNLTKLIFDYEHVRLLHAGPQLLLASIRESYWPIGGRNLARACYHKCILCRRLKGKVVTPLMGNLPRERLSPGYPFESTGIDYAGPIMSASRQGRGCRLVKVYIAIFVCFTTKAIHLELVGDLTSNSYRLALQRFISRRGKPTDIYSDNGTSFVGAHNDLMKFLKLHNSSLSESAANDGIKFHFIPAYAPHFGGLWEAGVKSTKYHLQRVLGNCNLTFEELYTALTKIEAVLNSRPLTPLSSDPADYTPLTPGHFLIGRSITSLPQPDYQDHSACHLSRFQRIEQLRQHFWSRWSKEYVAELQMRTKWRSCKDGLQLNSLVVIKEDNLPPLKWRLGRIVAVHPGADGVVRVADIRTSTGMIRRAFNRICPLPVSSDSG